jgi:type I restriction enzyme M protein
MKISINQLEQYLSKAAWILKGPVDASDFKSYIFPLLFFKRISDVYDEEFNLALEESNKDKEYAALKEFHRFLIPKDCHWKDVREKTQNVGLKIESSLRGMEQSNQGSLSGIFGDVQWSNKEKLSDSLLINLVEHFSIYNLSNSNVETDILGQSYEYLIKHFADLTNKKAGEFYTPRSVINLLTLILEPKENDSIYDPACGTGGMLIECINYLKLKNRKFKTLKIYGQEKNLNTNSIARINMFLHDVEDFNIKVGDTLTNPAFYEKDNLKKFDCVVANPPFSLKNWGAENWFNDPYGRNFADTPPKGNGDMAWLQHMIKSLNSNGRMGVILPHGILFRKGAEERIRKKILELDLIECVIGLGPNIFYGTTLAPCILILKKRKEKTKKGKIIFIDASNLIKVTRSQNYLEQEHIDQIFDWYKKFEDVKNHVTITSESQLKKNNYNLNISLYIKKVIKDDLPSFKEAIFDLKKNWNDYLVIKENFEKKLNRFIK